MAVNPTVISVKDSYSFIVDTVRSSSLNFSIQETPYSLYFTIRKSFVQRPVSSAQMILNSMRETQVNCDVEALKVLEDSNNILRNDYEEAIKAREVSHKSVKDLESKVEMLEETLRKFKQENQQADKKIKELKRTNDTLENDIEVAEKNWKKSNRLFKEKETEVNQLKKEIASVTDNLVQVKTDFAHLTAKVNLEAKKEKKNVKKTEKKELSDQMKASSPLKCDKCDVEAESLLKLKVHERLEHMKSNIAQTDQKVFNEKSVQHCIGEFLSEKYIQTDEAIIEPEEEDEYLCYYCDKIIKSELQLTDHRTMCSGSTRMFCFAPLGLSSSFKPPRPIPTLSLGSTFWPFSPGCKF